MRNVQNAFLQPLTNITCSSHGVMKALAKMFISRDIGAHGLYDSDMIVNHISDGNISDTAGLSFATNRKTLADQRGE